MRIGQVITESIRGHMLFVIINILRGISQPLCFCFCFVCLFVCLFVGFVFHKRGLKVLGCGGYFLNINLE